MFSSTSKKFRFSAFFCCQQQPPSPLINLLWQAQKRAQKTSDSLVLQVVGACVSSEMDFSAKQWFVLASAFVTAAVFFVILTMPVTESCYRDINAKNESTKNGNSTKNETGQLDSTFDSHPKHF